MMATKQIQRPNPQEFTTVKGAAEMTFSSEPTIRRMLWKKKLRRYKFGGRTLIRVSELMTLIKPA